MLEGEGGGGAGEIEGGPENFLLVKWGDANFFFLRMRGDAKFGNLH